MTETGKTIDLNLALQNPGRVFATPEKVAEHPSLSLQDKILILRSWEYGARDLEVAEEEGMESSTGKESLLKRILILLSKLDEIADDGNPCPTKHGTD